jgi:hypothetical protein
MATADVLLSKTFIASGNGLSAALDQFIFVKMGTNKKVLPAGAGERTIGISQGTAINTQGLDVGSVGFSKLRLAGTVSANQYLKPDTNGEGVRHLGDTPGAALACEDGVDDDVILVLITNFGPAT